MSAPTNRLAGVSEVAIIRVVRAVPPPAIKLRVMSPGLKAEINPPPAPEAFWVATGKTTYSLLAVVPFSGSIAGIDTLKLHLPPLHLSRIPIRKPLYPYRLQEGLATVSGIILSSPKGPCYNSCSSLPRRHLRWEGLPQRPQNYRR